MFTKRQVVGVVLTMLVAAPASPAVGPSCSQVLDQIGTEAQSFQAEAREMGLHFVRDVALQQSLDTAKGGLEPGWNATMTEREEAWSALRAGKDKLDDWKANVKMWNAQLLDLQLCVNDPDCSLIKKSELLNEDIRQWLESLGPEGTAAAAKRVNKAATLLQGYTSRLAGSATSSVSAAASCMDESGPQQTSSDAVDLRNTQPPPEPPAAEQPAVSKAKKSGVSGGKVAAATVLAGGAVAAAVYAGQMANQLATSGSAECYSSRNCIVSVMSSGCSCGGTLNAGCDWTGSVGGTGDGCGGGMPCRAGLSCNNGRCEESNGRCPF
jgi:hypothetical protein